MRLHGSVLRNASVVVPVVGLALAGCGGDGASGGKAAGDGAVVVLAKADGWRDGLADATGQPFVLAEIVADDDVERAWADNVPDGLPDRDGDPADPGVYQRLEDVDLDRQALVVLSSGESGTCPVWVSDLSAVDGRLEVLLRSTAEPGQACTDDFHPYRLVLAIDRERLPAAGELPLDQVDVPSENLYDVSGLVAAYPAG